MMNMANARIRKLLSALGKTCRLFSAFFGGKTRPGWFQSQY